MTLRHFVLIEPFRKSDVSIFPDSAAGIRAATTLYNMAIESGKLAKYVSQYGTLNDLKGTLNDLKREVQERDARYCGLCDEPIKEGNLCQSCRNTASRM